MIKMISIFSLPEGTDPEGFWKYWNEVHVPDIKKLNGLKKYAIHRVKKKLAGDEKFWGLVETWWNSEEDMRKAFGTPEGQSAAGDFWPRVTGRSSVLVEENVIIAG
ncbi:MAG: EthD family reductase [Desulfobacteraceae bacterium]|nr:MAG: EthD family reductase [Desulfobacteraceae bacterium]